MATEKEVYINSRLARAALNNGLFASEDSFEAERDRLMEDQTLYINKKISSKKVEIGDRCCNEGHVNISREYKEKKVATVGTEKGLLSKLSSNLLASAGWKEAKGTRSEDTLIGIVSAMSMEFALHVEKFKFVVTLQRSFQACSFYSRATEKSDEV